MNYRTDFVDLFVSTINLIAPGQNRTQTPSEFSLIIHLTTSKQSKNTKQNKTKKHLDIYLLRITMKISWHYRFFYIDFEINTDFLSGKVVKATIIICPFMAIIF